MPWSAVSARASRPIAALESSLGTAVRVTTMCFSRRRRDERLFGVFGTRDRNVHLLFVPVGAALFDRQACAGVPLCFITELGYSYKLTPPLKDALIQMVGDSVAYAYESEVTGRHYVTSELGYIHN